MYINVQHSKRRREKLSQKSVKRTPNEYTQGVWFVVKNKVRKLLTSHFFSILQPILLYSIVINGINVLCKFRYPTDITWKAWEILTVLNAY